MAMQLSHEAPVLPVAPEESAQAAGVRYVSDTQPGIRRQRAGRGFCYHGLDGRPIRDPAVLRRMKALAIPPQTDVGSVRAQMDTCRPLDATPGDASNTGIIRAGAPCAMRPSMTG